MGTEMSGMRYQKSVLRFDGFQPIHLSKQDMKALMLSLVSRTRSFDYLPLDIIFFRSNGMNWTITPAPKCIT